MGKSESTSRFWIIASGGAFLLALAAAALFVAFADRITFIPNAAYYILLLPLGAAAAAFLFGAMRSYARYTGTVVGGTLELGGPVVIFALVVAGGYYFAGAESSFDLTVRLHGPAGPTQLITDGRVMVDFGENRRTEPIGDNGQARFLQIPPRFRAGTVRVIPIVERYALRDTSRFRIPPDGVIELQLDRIPDSTRLRGTVFDPAGRTVAGARLSFSDGLAETRTNENGEFSIILPAAEGQTMPLLVTLDGAVVYDNYAVISASNSLRIQTESPD